MSPFPGHPTGFSKGDSGTFITNSLQARWKGLGGVENRGTLRDEHSDYRFKLTQTIDLNNDGSKDRFGKFQGEAFIKTPLPYFDQIVPQLMATTNFGKGYTISAGMNYFPERDRKYFTFFNIGYDSNTKNWSFNVGVQFGDVDPNR